MGPTTLRLQLLVARLNLEKYLLSVKNARSFDGKKISVLKKHQPIKRKIEKKKEKTRRTLDCYCSVTNSSVMMTSKTSHFGSCSVENGKNQKEKTESIFNAECTTYVWIESNWIVYMELSEPFLFFGFSNEKIAQCAVQIQRKEKPYTIRSHMACIHTTFTSTEMKNMNNFVIPNSLIQRERKKRFCSSIFNLFTILFPPNFISN